MPKETNKFDDNSNAINTPSIITENEDDTCERERQENQELQQE